MENRARQIAPRQKPTIKRTQETKGLQGTKSALFLLSNTPIAPILPTTPIPPRVPTQRATPSYPTLLTLP